VSATLAELQRRAVELAKDNNFGPDALDVNLEITRVDAANQGAWTRLARCYLEQRRFPDAAGALATVLDLNPSNTIARSLLNEVTRRRAAALPAAEAASGFTSHDFDALGHLAPMDAAGVLGSRIQALLLSVNDQRTSVRIVESRTRAGQSGSRLFHRNSYHAGASGHIYAYHHGGRWEPQFNIGFFSRTPWGGDWVRVGLGFNLADTGRDPDRDQGQEQIVSFFESFQRQVAGSWRSHLVEWMEKSGGFIQYGDRAPAMELLPKQAVEWLINCRNPLGQGWIFVGRWLSLDKPADAATLASMSKLVQAVDETFAALFPLWASIYTRGTE
jgi:hypothetical protein